MTLIEREGRKGFILILRLMPRAVALWPGWARGRGWGCEGLAWWTGRGLEGNVQTTSGASDSLFVMRPADSLYEWGSTCEGRVRGCGAGQSLGREGRFKVTKASYACVASRGRRRGGRKASERRGTPPCTPAHTPRGAHSLIPCHSLSNN